MLDVSPRPRYWNFGYIPTGLPRYDWKFKLTGIRNYIKRLQAPDLVRALALKPTDVALDLGCGHGYVTVEMAKLTKKAYGLDVDPRLLKTRIPDRLIGKLEFRVVSDVTIPFPDAHFDVVLASEVLAAVPDTMHLMAEIYRVLKPGGRLVILNGASHPGIAEAYRTNAPVLRRLRTRYGDRVPNTYEAYCEKLQNTFHNAQRCFFQREDIERFVRDTELELLFLRGTPSKSGGDHFSWSQFRSYLKTGNTLYQDYFLLRFFWFSLLSIFDRRPFKGGVLCAARKRC